MAYEWVHHTRCTTVAKHIGLSVPLLVVADLVVALIAGFFLPPLALVAALLAVIAYCAWWLYDRLICLGGEECAIGLLGAVEPPDKKSGFDAIDTDYSINLVLAPHNPQELPADYIANPPAPAPGEDPEKPFKEALHRKIADDGIQGRLIKETHTTGDVKTVFGGKKFGFEGLLEPYPGSSVLYTYQPYLHCEFEGAGVLDLYKAAQAALAVAAVASVACAIPLIGWAVCLILSVVAIVITAVGLGIGLSDTGKPNFFDGKFPGIHSGRDILFVRGVWVYDSAHEGWNELHPLVDCRIVAKATYLRNDVVDWDDAIKDYMIKIGKWHVEAGDPAKLVKAPGTPTDADWLGWVADECAASKAASSPLTGDNQNRPENKWAIHPVIDGCKPVSPPPIPSTPPVVVGSGPH
jgi:hypothetical protein